MEEKRNEAIEELEVIANNEIWDQMTSEESSGGGKGKLIGLGLLAAGAVVTAGVLIRKKLKKKKAMPAKVEPEEDEELFEDEDDYVDCDYEELEVPEENSKESEKK